MSFLFNHHDANKAVHFNSLPIDIPAQYSKIKNFNIIYEEDGRAIGSSPSIFQKKSCFLIMLAITKLFLIIGTIKELGRLSSFIKIQIFIILGLFA